jgi:Flp pilus assembly protein TadD
MLLDAADELEPAIAELREAHRLAPGEWRPLNDLGTLLNARSREEPKRGNEAVKTLEQAAALAPPKELAPRYNLALAYWNAGSPAQARETIDDLLKGAPADHPVAAQARQFLEAVTRAGG